MGKLIKKHLLATSIICSSLFMAAPVFAEEIESYDLDTMVVTATRTLKQLQEVPSSVSVITSQNIQEKNITSVREALQTLPGVYMDPTAQSGIQMRGFGGSDVLVLVDGQQMNTTYNGSTQYNSIPVENIERIEVVRGAASSIYGGHAVGGVINIITKEVTKPGTHGEAVVSYGSNNTWKKAINIAAKANDKISLGVGYENSKSDGYQGYYVTKSGSEKSYSSQNTTADYLKTLSNGKILVGERGRKKWNRENYNFNIKYNFDESKSLKYTFTQTDYEYKYGQGKSYIKDSSGKMLLNGKVNTGNLGFSINTRDFYGTDNQVKRDTHGLVYKDEDNNFKASFNYIDTKTDGFSSPTSRGDLNNSLSFTGEGDYSSHPGRVYNLNFEKAWENVGQHSIVVGGSFQNEEMTQDRFTLSAWHDKNSKINHYAQDHGEAKNLALFAQDEYKLTDPLTMYVGLRYDRYTKGAGTFWSSDPVYNTKSSSETYNELSPKVAFDFKANDKTNYYVSYGHSFNPPEMYRIYRYSEFSSYWYIPNPDLKPETSDSFELGMKNKLSEDTNLNISLFTVDTDDKIAASPVNKLVQFNGKDTKKYINFDKEKRKGAEIELTHKFSPKYSSYINYTWQHGKLNKSGVNSQNFDIPKHLLHAGMQYKHDKWNALLDFQYVSERQDPSTDLSGIGAEEAFFIVNTAINYKLNKDLNFQFAIHNLLDKEYYASEATSSRTYTFGMRYSF